MAANAGPALAALCNNNPDMNAYLQNVMGVVTQGVRGNILNNGFRVPATLATKKQDWVQHLCMNVRKNGLGNATTRNLSVEVEENLKKFQMWCVFRTICQRPLDYADATMDQLDSLWAWHDQSQETPLASTLSGFNDKSDKRVWFEAFDNRLKLTKGASGLPIDYVVRTNAALPVDDPGFGLPDYGTELRTRGRHNGTWYRSDRAKVWHLLFDLCHGTTAWHTIQAYQATTDGRAAYLALRGQYLGSDVAQLLMKRAEDFLANARFDGQSKNFTSDKFFGRFRQAFNDLGPNDQMSEQRKVTKLRSAWQVKGLEHLDAMIAADQRLNSNFEAAVTFLSEQYVSYRTKNTGSHTRTISSLDTNGNGGGNGGGNGRGNRNRNNRRVHKKSQNSAKHRKFDPKNPGKYLPGPAWAKLTPDQKAKATKARTDAGIPTREDRQRQISVIDAEEQSVLDPDDDVEMETESETEVEELSQGVRELHMTQRKAQEIKAKRDQANRRQAAAAKKAAKKAKKQAAKAAKARRGSS